MATRGNEHGSDDESGDAKIYWHSSLAMVMSDDARLQGA
jgi:hypothetical protein